MMLQGPEFWAFVQRATLLNRLELFLALFADAVAYGTAGYLLRSGGRVGAWTAVLAPGLLTLPRLRLLVSSDSGTALGPLTLNLVVILLNVVIIMLVVRSWRHIVTEGSTAPERPGASRSAGLVVAILCFGCGILVALFTMSFVITGLENANPLATLALVYLVAAIAYCTAGFLVLRRRRAGGVVAILTAAVWSAPLLLYDGQPGWPWTGSSSFFLVANVVIALLVVLIWRDQRSQALRVGG
jgi:hypothetical protein